MVNIINVKNNTEAIKVLNMAKRTFENVGFQNVGEKKYNIRAIKDINKEIKKINSRKKRGVQTRQLYINFY